jgi:iron complex transport system ATP-binding protein
MSWASQRRAGWAWWAFVSLSAADLTFAYGGRVVVDGVSLDVRPGALVAILGPNGSGKTTLVRLLSGALVPRSGRVRLDDEPIGAIDRRQLAQRIAFVPQETTLAFDYSVLEIVLMGRYPHLGAFEVEGPADLSASARALEATGTLEFADRPFMTLSGGEKQRVVIASALAQLDPGPAGRGPAGGGETGATGVLLLDEPTASLDLRYQIEIGALLERMVAGGLAVALTTHDLRLAARIATTVVLLSRGRVLAAGSPREVLTPDLVGALFEIDPAQAAPAIG